MCLDDNNSQIGIEFARRKLRYIGFDENKTPNQNYLLDGQ